MVDVGIEFVLHGLVLRGQTCAFCITTKNKKAAVLLKTLPL
jgi:hypothetical protein